MKTTKKPPTGLSGAKGLTPDGNSLMYIETSASNSGDVSVFVSFEKTDSTSK